MADGRRTSVAWVVTRRPPRDRLTGGQLLDEQVRRRVVQEVAEAEHHSLRGNPARALGQAFVGDDDIGVGRDLVDGCVDDFDVEPRVLEALLQLVGADEARSHSGLTGKNNEPHVGSRFLDHG
jgi:hypothetical protein